MDRIQKVSYKALLLFNLLLVALPLEAICYWSFIDSTVFADLVRSGLFVDLFPTPDGLVHLTKLSWTFEAKMIALIGDFVGKLPLLLGLFSLKTLFKNYHRGAIFTGDNAKCYRQLGFLLFFDAIVARPLAGILTVLGATWTNAPGHRFITLNFGLFNMGAIFLALLLMVISWVMIEAVRIEEESHLTV